MHVNYDVISENAACGLASRLYEPFSNTSRQTQVKIARSLSPICLTSHMEESTRSRDSSICDLLQITTFSLLIARYGTRGMPELSDRWLLFVLFERSLMVRWVVGSILHGVDPLSYFSFQPVLHNWCNKSRGMCYPVCGMVHIKEPLLLIDKSSLCGGSGFPFSLSEWSLTICLTPYNRR